MKEQARPSTYGSWSRAQKRRMRKEMRKELYIVLGLGCLFTIFFFLLGYI